MPSAERRRAAGFTLLEVLVALAVVGLTLAAVAGVFGNGLLGHEAASDAEAALALADERLSLAGAVPALRPGTESGIFAGRFAWQTTISSFDDSSDSKVTRQPIAPPLYQIAVSVTWHNGRRSRLLALSTLRLGAVQ